MQDKTNLITEAKKFKSAEEFVEAQKKNKMYHVSDNPNLIINKDYKPKQGQLGKGLYVTKDPEIWQGGQIGKRPYVYEIDANNLKIANDYPVRSELMDWGSKNGYYKKDFLKKPNGEYVLGQDGNPMKIWQETPKSEKLMDYKDPMTGSKMSGLEQEYLKSKGYDGVSASYSPDGEQSLIFNYDKIKINPIKTKSQLTAIWNKAHKTTPETSLITEAKKYKSADEFVKGDKLKILDNNVTIDYIHRGDMDIKLINGDTKKIFIPDNEATIIVKNIKGQKRELSYNYFKEIIEKQNIEKKRKVIMLKKNKERKKIFDEKTLGKMYKVGVGNISKLKRTDFFIFNDTKYIIDKVKKYDDNIVYSIVQVQSPRKSYQYNKENYTINKTKSQLIDIWRKYYQQRR